jgi:very-short-patch-repair endonuclease
MSPTELMLWSNERFRSLNPVSQDKTFFKDNGVCRFIMDFALWDYKLRIEIDDASHRIYKRMMADEKSDRYALSQGWRTLRISTDRVLENIESVVDIIFESLYKELLIKPAGPNTSKYRSFSYDDDPMWADVERLFGKSFVLAAKQGK